MKALCEGKKNCRRKILLKALGSDEFSSVSKNVCCDCCHPVCPYQSLLFSSATTEGRKRRVRIRPISDDIKALLTSKLIEARDSAIESNPVLKMLPNSVVCPVTVTIKDIASRSISISSIEDVRSFPCIRPEFHETFI